MFNPSEIDLRLKASFLKNWICKWVKSKPEAKIVESHLNKVLEDKLKMTLVGSHGLCLLKIPRLLRSWVFTLFDTNFAINFLLKFKVIQKIINNNLVFKLFQQFHWLDYLEGHF